MGAFSAVLKTLSEHQAGLLGGITAASGDDFLCWLLEFSREACGADYALISERGPSAREGEPGHGLGYLHTWTPPTGTPVAHYRLAGGPFDPELARGVQTCLDGARRAHSADRLLRALGTEAFVSLPLAEDEEGPLGYLVLLYRRPLDADAAAHAEQLVTLLRPRAETELRLRTHGATAPNMPTSLERRRLETLGTLAPTLAHDINNLLCCIQGNTELARSEAEENPLVAEALEDANHAVLRASQLCREVLLYAKAPDGETDIEVGQLLREFQGLLQIAAGPGAKVHVETRGQAVHIRGARTHVQQLALELVSQSAAALRRRGARLTLEVGTELPPFHTATGPMAFLRASAGGEAGQVDVAPSRAALADAALSTLRRAAARLRGRLLVGDAYGDRSLATVWLELPARPASDDAEPPRRIRPRLVTPVP